MDEIILEDPFISINGTALSPHVASATLRIKRRGLMDWHCALEFYEDDDGEIESILLPLLGESAELVIRSDENPAQEYRGKAILSSFPDMLAGDGPLVEAGTCNGYAADCRDPALPPN